MEHCSTPEAPFLKAPFNNPPTQGNHYLLIAYTIFACFYNFIEMKSYTLYSSVPYA